MSTDSRESGTTGTSSTVALPRSSVPHRWKKLLVVLPSKCVACLDGLPVARHSLKCQDCGILCHRRCVEYLRDTCGMAGLYAEPRHPTSDSRMNGCVKLWRSTGWSGWKDTWAKLEGGRLSFYPSGGPHTEAVEEVDLVNQNWRLHFRSGVDPQDTDYITDEDLPHLVEINVKPIGVEPYRLYFMTPTLEAKQRWVNALQSATSQKIVRRISSLVGVGDRVEVWGVGRFRFAHPGLGFQRLMDNAFLRLEEPYNISVECTAIRGDALLFGSDDGLYFISMHKRSSVHASAVPTRIEGIDSVHQMEIVEDSETVILVYGASTD